MKLAYKMLFAVALMVLITALASQSFAVSYCEIEVVDNGHNAATKTVFLPESQDLESDVLYLRMENVPISTDTMTISLLTITASGTANDASDITSASLFKDTNDDAQFDAGDTEIDTATYAADDGTMTFNNLGSNLVLAPSTGAGVFVVYYIKPSTAKGSTFVASFANSGDIDTTGCAGGPIYTSTGVTGPTVTATYGSASVAAGTNNPAAGTAYAGDTDVPMLQLAVTSGSEEPTSLDSLTVTDSAATRHFLVSAVKVWHDADGDGTVSSGDTQLGSDATFTEGVNTLKIASLGHQIAAGATSDILVTYDFAAPVTALLDKKSEFLKIAKGWIKSIISAPFSLAGCGGGGTTGVTLGGAPAGFVFTDTSGNEINEAKEGDTVELRATDGTTVLQFTVGTTAVSLSGVTIERDAEGTYVSLPASVTGLPSELTVMVPCQEGNTVVQVCPEETGMPTVFPVCTSGDFLTQSAPASGGYTWDNAASRTGNDDCTVSGSLESFATFYAAGRTLTSLATSLASATDAETSGATSGRAFTTSGNAATGGSLTLIGY